MITVYFRLLADDAVQVLGGAHGVPDTLAELVTKEAARQAPAPGLWQASLNREEGSTEVVLERLGDEGMGLAVVQARRIDGEVELGEAWTDGGMGSDLASTQALASAAAHELRDLPEGPWHRLALTLARG